MNIVKRLVNILLFLMWTCRVGMIPLGFIMTIYILWSGSGYALAWMICLFVVVVYTDGLVAALKAGPMKYDDFSRSG